MFVPRLLAPRESRELCHMGFGPRHSGSWPRTASSALTKLVQGERRGGRGVGVGGVGWCQEAAGLKSLKIPDLLLGGGGGGEGRRENKE